MTVAAPPLVAPIRVSAPGGNSPTAASLEIVEGSTGRSALTMSPGPTHGASPRGSLLRRVRDFLSSKSPSFRRKGDSNSQQLQADSGPRGFGWYGLRSPRKASTANIRSMLQSMRTRMRRGSAAEVQEGTV